MMEFEGFPKIARLSRECVISEKIDGTNAAIVVTEDGQVYAQSRKRVITPGDDNYGFAAWVRANESDLALQLGIGRHFGEWWGEGIQRRYGLKEKRFSLFNLHRWHGSPRDGWRCIEAPLCFVVPTLAECLFDTQNIHAALDRLRDGGSLAAPGFMDPEGVVIYHTHANQMFKKTFEKDAAGKGEDS